MKNNILLFLFSIWTINSFGQTLKLKNQAFELHNVTGSIIKFEGKKVLKIERDLEALPFDADRLEETVDETHYARLVDLDDFENV